MDGSYDLMKKWLGKRGLESRWSMRKFEREEGVHRLEQEVLRDPALLRMRDGSVGRDLAAGGGLCLNPAAVVPEPSSHLHHDYGQIVGRLLSPVGMRRSNLRRNHGRGVVGHLFGDGGREKKGR